MHNYRILRALVLFLLPVLVVAAGCQTAAKPASQQQGGEKVPKQYSAPPAMAIDQNKSYSATLHTTKGDIKVDLFAKDAPQTVNNFVFLSRDGFYDDVKFHRIIKGFMVQTGDPTGTGAGSPGYRFKDEPVTRDYKRGIVAMANSGPNTNGSQFFIMHADYALPKNYTIFGQVTDQQSLETLDKIANVPVTTSRTGENVRADAGCADHGRGRRGEVATSGLTGVTIPDAGAEGPGISPGPSACVFALAVGRGNCTQFGQEVSIEWTGNGRHPGLTSVSSARWALLTSQSSQCQRRMKCPFSPWQFPLCPARRSSGTGSFRR